MLQRLAAPLEPRVHTLRRPSAQGNHRAAPVLGVLAPLDETVILEVACELARRRQREVELASQLTDAPLALRSDLRQQGHVPPAEGRIAAYELQQLLGGATACPEPAHHVAQEALQFCQVAVIGYHYVTIIGSEERR